MHKNNFRRRQKRVESRLDETVRIASIVQKGITSGRSSYVEMRALERIVRHNLKVRVELARSSMAARDGELAELLSKVMSIHGGYAEMLTPNGVLKSSELDRLLSVDSEISTCVGTIESLRSSRSKIKDVAAALKELLEERKKLVGSLRA